MGKIILILLQLDIKISKLTNLYEKSSCLLFFVLREFTTTSIVIIVFSSGYPFSFTTLIVSY